VLHITAQQRDVQQRLLSRAEGRSDDNLETIKKRFQV
jgi:adenylate kinase family enzyme